MNQNLGEALRHGRMGCPVFPLHTIKDGWCTCGKKCGKRAGKHPRTVHGFHDATTDEMQIRAWWRRWPNANVGMATGKLSGRLVLDIDPRHGGNESLKGVLDRREMPRTPTVRTGGGGRQFHFRLPQRCEPKSRIGLLPGMDVKARSGYAVLPPSMHRSGKRYKWLEGLGPEEVDLAPCPDWLEKLLQTTRKRRNCQTKIEDGKPILDGNRHNFLVRMAGALRRQGASSVDIHIALAAVNSNRCSPPVSDKDILTIAESAEGWKPGCADSQYSVTEDGIFWNKVTRDGILPTRLTNFSARIKADIAEDDGAEEHLFYEIEARLSGKTRLFHVPAAQFSNMNWANEHMGAGAIVSPGFGLRDHARAAVQELSSEIEERRVYAHSGWRKHEKQWVYLHTNGAIGRDGLITEVRVKLPPSLQGFSLPDPPRGSKLQTAIRASLRVLQLFPPCITYPAYSSIWASVMGCCDYSLFLVGPTGIGKTELAALEQQHFGPSFTARRLPGSWSSTANANEALAFTAKDALLVLDDFAPTGGRVEIARYQRDAERILRAQGNGSGRLRMRSDTTLRPPKVPRGLILCTGEDNVRGQSLRARTFVLEHPDDINWDLLTVCQRDAAAGLYALAMAGYLRWMAPRYDNINSCLRNMLDHWRNLASNSEQHKRTPEIVAHLRIGFGYFMRFAEEVEAITDDEADMHRGRFWKALGEAAAAQRRYQRADDPVRRFLELLRSELSTGRAQLGDAETGSSGKGTGVCIGWRDEELAYLNPDVAFATAQKLALDQGDGIAIGAKTLWARMGDRGLLARYDPDQRNLYKKTIGDRRMHVLTLHLETLGYTSRNRDERDGWVN